MIFYDSRYEINRICIEVTRQALTSALLIGMLAGSKAALIQYNISSYEQWLEDEITARKYNSQIYASDGPLTSTSKKIYNGILNATEDYGKFGLTETAYIAMARIAMWLLDIPNLPSGFCHEYFEDWL